MHSPYLCGYRGMRYAPHKRNVINRYLLLTLALACMLVGPTFEAREMWQTRFINGCSIPLAGGCGTLHPYFTSTSNCGNCSTKLLVCSHRKIKVWDLQAALDPRSPSGTLCLRTLVVRLFFPCSCWILLNHGTRLFQLLKKNWSPYELQSVHLVRKPKIRCKTILCSIL